MRGHRLAYLIIALAFLVATYLASLHPQTMSWGAFLPVIVLGAVGVFVLRRGQKRAATASHVLHGNRALLVSSLDEITEKLRDFDARKEQIPTEELRVEVDVRFRDHLLAFADARESLAHIYGLRAYANIMSSFAAGERYLNRVWSASTDGYGDEARTYISRALDQFNHAREALAALDKG